jgi:hypothetical protein
MGPRRFKVLIIGVPSTISWGNRKGIYSIGDPTEEFLITIERVGVLFV